MIEALMGGTSAMRAAGKAYLPQNPNEDDEDYRDRLNRATLASFFNETLNSLNGRIFAKPIALGDDVPESLKAWSENNDRRGNVLSVFWAKAWCVSFGLNAAGNAA